MPEAQDMDLVQNFARDNSDAAFAELVRRHINLVYSVARRYTGNDGDAQDVTQAVFIILARKAASLREKTLFSGWLYETTRFTASRLARTNSRRHAREQEAYMQSTLNEAGTAELWRQLEPYLETAMSKLAERDRALLMLRFYQNKNGPETAALLGIPENTAHKRVTRALEKLRGIFAKRGIDSSAETIAETISAHSVQAAPAVLAKSVVAAALAKGATTSVSTATLIKGALKVMAWAKVKTAVVIGAGLLILGGTTGYMIYTSHAQATLKARKIPPKIIAFKAIPFTAKLGQGFTISYTVSDRSGSHLNGIELWRAHTNGTGSDTWTQIGKTILLSGGGPTNGAFPVDMPKEGGNYWYGIHVSDHAGNVAYEDQAGFAPARVTVIP